MVLPDQAKCAAISDILIILSLLVERSVITCCLNQLHFHPDEIYSILTKCIAIKAFSLASKKYFFVQIFIKAVSTGGAGMLVTNFLMFTMVQYGQSFHQALILFFHILIASDLCLT